MRKIMAGLATLGLLLAVLGMAATTAQADDLSFGIGYTVHRGAPGTTVDIGGEKVPADLVGRTCNVGLMSENNRSIHPGNDVIITSASSVTFKDVESQAAAKTYPAQPITLGPELDADLRFGKNGVTSSGFKVTVDCPPPLTTTVPPTTEPPVTTTEPPLTTTEPPVTPTEPPVTTVPPTTVKPPVVNVNPPTIILAPPAPPTPAVPDYNG